MYEKDLTQTMLSEIIGVSPSRISEYLTGKSEPTLKVARNICIKLDISPFIVLGV
jgi:HTH-type transcriptional regulator/antitoxin HigA